MKTNSKHTTLIDAGAAQAQPAPVLGPPLVLNGSDARVFPTDISSEIKKLAPNVYAYVQLQPPGWSNFNISNCGIVAGSDSLLAIDTTAALIMAKRFLSAAYQETGKRFGASSSRIFTETAPAGFSSLKPPKSSHMIGAGQ